MKLIVGRHGETLYNQENVFRGTLEVPLNRRGEKQAALLSRALKDEQGAAIYASPQLRALNTAQIVARPHNLTPVAEPRLADLDFGEWQGKPIKEVEAQYPELYRQWQENPYQLQIPQGGNVRRVEENLKSLLVQLEAEFPEQTVILVTHRLVVKVLLVMVLQLPPQGYWQLKPEVASITRLEKHPKYFVLTSFNEQWHLRDESGGPAEMG